MPVTDGRQLLVECSDPGLVVSLSEELENVLRHIDFAQAQALKQQLSTLAQELGSEIAQAWDGFRLETPNDSGRPPSFGKRDAWDAEVAPLQCLAEQAAAHGLGQWEVRRTMLLPQDGPAPETRDQYVSDLADAMSYLFWHDLGVFQYPVPLPEAMADHRRQLMDEHAGDALRAGARHATVGFPWLNDMRQRLEGVLAEVNTCATAVMRYELQRLVPADVDFDERLRWLALAVRLGHEFETWYTAVERDLPYVCQRAALVDLMWHTSRGHGRARSMLDARLQSLIAEADEVYTDDGVAALRRLDERLHEPPLFPRLVAAADEAHALDVDIADSDAAAAAD
jgi:hypothetical protein